MLCNVKCTACKIWTTFCGGILCKSVKLTEPPDAEPHVRWCERSAAKAASYSINGERHISFRYWTRTATFELMLAEDHMALYREEETGDVIAVNYVLDRTEHYRLEEKERALEKSNREYAKLLEEEKKHTAMIEELTKKLQSQLELFTVSIPGGVKISNDDPEYSFKYVSEQFANMLGYATPKELLDASGYHRTAGKRQRNPDTVLFKKRRASISFYLWKSGAFKTDIS